MTRMLMIFLSAAAAGLAFVAYMLFSWARLIAAFVLFLVPLPQGFLIKPMLLCFWLAPYTTGSAAASVLAQKMLDRMLQGTLMSSEAALFGVAAGVQVLYTDDSHVHAKGGYAGDSSAYPPRVMFWIAVLHCSLLSLLRWCNFRARNGFNWEGCSSNALRRWKIADEIRKTLSAGINEIRSRGVVSQQLLFIFASCCWAPHVTTAAAVGLSAWALATRPRRSPLLPASVQQRKGLLQAREDQLSAWEEEEKAALADVRSGRRIHSTRRFGEDKDSYLHVACKHGDLSACELLLQMPLYSGMWAADHVHVQWHVGELHMNARGKTALHFAARSGSAAVVNLLLESTTAQLRVDVDARAAYDDGGFGRTPLHEAALKGHVEAARVLLEHGCHIGLPCGFEDETPLAFAIKHGQLRVVQLLYSYGTLVWWHEECRNQRGTSEAEEASGAWPDIRDWMRKRRKTWGIWGPLHYLEVLTVARTRCLLRLCDERSEKRSVYVRAVRRARHCLERLKSGASCAKLGDGPWRECAELIVCSADPWSPRNHETFPRGARQRAAALLLIGAQLARSLPGADALLDAWVHVVMPNVLERRRYGAENDDPHSPGEEALLFGGTNARTEPRAEDRLVNAHISADLEALMAQLHVAGDA